MSPVVDSLSLSELPTFSPPAAKMGSFTFRWWVYFHPMRLLHYCHRPWSGVFGSTTVPWLTRHCFSLLIWMAEKYIDYWLNALWYDRPYNGNEVFVTGTFDDWGKTVHLDRNGDVFEKTISLPDTDEKIQYKVCIYQCFSTGLSSHSWRHTRLPSTITFTCSSHFSLL